MYFSNLFEPNFFAISANAPAVFKAERLSDARYNAPYNFGNFRITELYESKKIFLAGAFKKSKKSTCSQWISGWNLFIVFFIASAALTCPFPAEHEKISNFFTILNGLVVSYSSNWLNVDQN